MENNFLSPINYTNSVSSPVSAGEVKSNPFVHSELQKSLEAITSSHKTGDKLGPLENMLSDKSKTLKATVNALLEEIKLRKDINSSQFQKINGEICRQHTELMQLDNLQDHNPFDLTKDIDEAKDKLKSNVLELEKEKRKEQLECWRDLMFLKKYLMVSLKDYWELARKRGVLESNSISYAPSNSSEL